MLIFKAAIAMALAIAVLGTAGSAHAQTNEFIGLRAQMSATRESLVQLMSQDNLSHAELHKRLKDQTDAVTSKLNVLAAPTGKTAQFRELSDTWKDYAKTYEQAFAPAARSGKRAEAQQLAAGDQRKRMLRMQQLLADLSQS